MKHILPLLFLSPLAMTAEAQHPFSRRDHTVRHMNGEREPTAIPAEMQWISEPWLRAKPDENAQMPYLAYFPEKDRVLMLVETHQLPDGTILTAFGTGFRNPADARICKMDIALLRWRTRSP